ncbi:hypothetical protein [Phyllobacterium sp. P5_D12]
MASRKLERCRCSAMRKGRDGPTRHYHQVMCNLYNATTTHEDMLQLFLPINI